MGMGYIYVFNTLVRFNKDYSKKKVALRNLFKGLVPSTICCLSVCPTAQNSENTEGKHQLSETTKVTPVHRGFRKINPQPHPPLHLFPRLIGVIAIRHLKMEHQRGLLDGSTGTAPYCP